MSARGYRRIGLTGGIGSGKTTVAKRLGERGALVLDADALSRSALERDGACYEAVAEAFGGGILRADGTIDRAALAHIVFADPAKRERLNGIVHPYVIATLLGTADRALAQRPGAIAVFDVPLLFESGMHRDMDHTVLVVASEAARVGRVAARDGAAVEAVQKRIRSQMPEEEKRLLANEILDNNATLEELLVQADRLYERLTEFHV